MPYFFSSEIKKFGLVLLERYGQGSALDFRAFQALIRDIYLDFGAELSLQEIEEQFKSADRNCSGQIELDEFLTWSYLRRVVEVRLFFYIQSESLHPAVYGEKGGRDLVSTDAVIIRWRSGCCRRYLRCFGGT